METMHRSQRLTPIFSCKASPSLNNIVVGHMRIIRSSEFPDLSDQTHPAFDSDGRHISIYMMTVC